MLDSTQLYLTQGYVSNIRAYRQKQNVQMKGVVTIKHQGKHIKETEYVHFLQF